MIEKHFFADPDTPFHVWVRERCGTQGYRWVLRHASQVIQPAGQSVRDATPEKRNRPASGRA